MWHLGIWYIFKSFCVGIMTSQFLTGTFFNRDRLLALFSLSLLTLFSSSSCRLNVSSIVCTVLRCHGTAWCNILHKLFLFFVWHLEVVYGEMMWRTIYTL